MSGLLVVLQYSASSTTVHTTTEYVLLLVLYMFCGHTMSRSLGTFFEWHSVKARTCARCKNFKISARTLTLVSLNIRTFYILMTIVINWWLGPIKNTLYSSGLSTDIWNLHIVCTIFFNKWFCTFPLWDHLENVDLRWPLFLKVHFSFISKWVPTRADPEVKMIFVISSDKNSEKKSYNAIYNKGKEVKFSAMA